VEKRRLGQDDLTTSLIWQQMGRHCLKFLWNVHFHLFKEPRTLLRISSTQGSEKASEKSTNTSKSHFHWNSKNLS
jgi:hypothetical protein